MPPSVCVGGRPWPRGRAAGPQAQRDPGLGGGRAERSGSLSGAAARPPAPGDSSCFPPLTPGGRRPGRRWLRGLPGPPRRGAGVRQAPHCLPGGAAVPCAASGAGQGALAAGSCGGLGRGASARARLAGGESGRRPLQRSRGCGARPAARSGGGGGARPRGISLAMQTRRRLLPREVSERRPALRPQAREAGVSPSPGPCRPERGPAGGRGGLGRLSGAAVSPTPPRLRAWGLGVTPHPAALVPRTPPRGEATIAPQPSPAARPVLRAPSPPFPSACGCLERGRGRGTFLPAPQKGKELSPPSIGAPPGPPVCRCGARRGCSRAHGARGRLWRPARSGEDSCLHVVPFLWPDLRSPPRAGNVTCSSRCVTSHSCNGGGAGGGWGERAGCVL